MDAKVSLLLLLAASIVLGFLRMAPTTAPVPGIGPVVEIDFWNGFTGPDGRKMLQLIRRFNEQNPDVHVTMQRMEWPIYYNKLMVAGIGGRGPEAFVIHASTLPRMHRGGFLGDVEALFDGSDALPLDDFDPKLMHQIRFDHKLVGVPLDVHPHGLYCNADMLRAAGLTDDEGGPRPPQTRGEFMGAMRRLLIDANADGRPEQWGFALTQWRFNFMSLVPQFGGRYFDESGRCVLDCPENVEALTFLVSLLQEHRLIPAPENNLGWVGFRQNRVAMVFDGVYMLGDLLRLDTLDYVAAPLPVLGPLPGTHADSHVLCLRGDLEAEEKESVLRLMRFLSRRGVEWAEAGQVPARRSARETEAFKALPVQSAFSKTIEYVKYPPRTPGLLELQEQIDYAAEKAMRGRSTPQQALTEARENFEAFMKNAGLPMLMEDES